MRQLCQATNLLLAYVCFIKDEMLVQELLSAKQLETDTKVQSIFRVVEQFFKDNEIPLTNIIACATDGAPSVKGHAYIKKLCQISLLFTVLFTTNIWLQRTSVHACTNH